MTNIVTESFSFPIIQWLYYDIDKMPNWDDPGDWDMQAAIRMIEDEQRCQYKFPRTDEYSQIIGFNFVRETDEVETYILDLDEDPLYRIDGEAPWEDELPF